MSRKRFVVLLTIYVCTCIMLSACQRDTAFAQADPAYLVASSTSTPLDPLAASVVTKVVVPQTMRTSPFNIDRYLTIPSQFHIAVYTRIAGARFMAMAPNGDLLVSEPDSGKVVLVRPDPHGPHLFDFVTGLRRPQDIIFHVIGKITYVYIAETNQIDRFIYHNGDIVAHNRQVIITGLPDSHWPEFNGAYSHELKDIVFDTHNKLYVSLGSSCNVCVSDTTSNPKRATIYQYNADGSKGRLYAQGLRNAEGLAILPGTDELWVAVNNRDNIAYPFNDSTGNYQQVLPWYVDNHPPDEFIHVRDGGNYGWPFCNPDPDKSLNNMPFDRDVQFNADGHVNCAQMDRVTKGIQAHSAPLGLTFLQNTAAPATYRNGALIALHGSWDRTKRTGYKLAYFPWQNATQTPGAQIDLVTGWLDNAHQQVWGKPVDSVIDSHGNIFISDDLSGTVYKLYV